MRGANRSLYGSKARLNFWYLQRLASPRNAKAPRRALRCQIWLREGATDDLCDPVPKKQKPPRQNRRRHRNYRWLRGLATYDFCGWSRARCRGLQREKGERFWQWRSSHSSLRSHVRGVPPMCPMHTDRTVVPHPPHVAQVSLQSSISLMVR